MRTAGLAIVIVSAVSIAAALFVADRWPSNEQESRYTCEWLRTSDAVEEIRVCIGKETVNYVDNCREVRSVLSDSEPVEVVRDGYDKLCLSDDVDYEQLPDE